MIYASETPCGDRFIFWADHVQEAEAALYAVGGDPETQRDREANAWDSYRVTPEQFADLIGLGLRITDRYGPALWRARRDGHRHIERCLLDAGAREL